MCFEVSLILMDIHVHGYVNVIIFIVYISISLECGIFVISEF
jgi:hypothetical protein